MGPYGRWTGLLGCCLFLAALGGSPAPVRSQEAGAPDRGRAREVAGVVATRDTLSVDVRGEDFAAIFRNVAAGAQFEVSNLEGLPGRHISTRFNDLPVMEGVKRLLRVAGVAGYVIVTAHSGDRVKIERILFLDGNANAGAEPRVAATRRTASRRARRMNVRSERARSRRAPRNPREADKRPSAVLDDLRDSPETEQFLNQAVHPDEQVRERAIEGLVRLVGGSDRKPDLMEALGAHLDELRHGDEEAREEAREEILSIIRR